MNRLTGWLQRIWLVLLVAGVIIAFDQWTKAWVRATIPDFTYTVPIPALEEYFVFEHVRNYGAAFGILQNWGNFFIIVAAVVATAILLYAANLPLHQRLIRVLLGLQLGGALGNVIDRLYQGYVTDFVKTGIPDFYYIPNYNIADSAIVIGVIGLGIYIFAEDIRQQRQPQPESVGNGPTADSTPAPSQEL